MNMQVILPQTASPPFYTMLRHGSIAVRSIVSLITARLVLNLAACMPYGMKTTIYRWLDQVI